MLISPPFLPQRTANGPDEPWLSLAMNAGGFGDGAFPLGADLAWHGGIHLTAPRDGDKRLPLRAMADGTVAYVRQPRRQTADADDPLNYGGGWTDDGCVVIRHDTEIGEGLSVCYFSVCLHLKRVATDVRQGQKIWRKEEIGEAGSIYGKPGHIHCEIVCDDANLATLLGRTSGSFGSGMAGRTPSVFGNIYLQLPAGTPFYDDVPKPPEHVGHWSENTALPTPAWASTDALIIAISLARTTGAMLTTLTTSGQTIGSTPAVADVAMFDAAQTLARNHSVVARDAYELLRFGRVLEPISQTADLAYWRQVAYPGGVGWVDLHAQGVTACSDADFPDWAGWRLIDDDVGSDSRCDSATLIDLILQNSGGATKARRTDVLGKLSGNDVQTRLARTICKFPTEWEKATVTARWQWLTKETPPGAGPMAGPFLKQEDFPRFKAHSEALCFWEDARLGIPSKHWHFHPREFVRAFRQCGWLSADEMYQLFPMTAMRKAGQSWVSETVRVVASTIDAYHVELNKACRRYGIVTPLRMAAFYANAMEETQWFARLEEQASTTHPPRYYPWNGRGFLQLTWPDNYIKYWRFVGKTVNDDLAEKLNAAQRKADKDRTSASLEALEATVATASMKGWRDNISGKTHVAADSAGAYWAWSHASQFADLESANQRAIKSATGAGSHTYYTSANMGCVAATVNIGYPSTHYAGVNGIVARFQAYNTCTVILMDTPAFPGSNKLGEPQNYKSRQP